MRRFLKQILHGIGYEIKRCSNCQETCRELTPLETSLLTLLSCVQELAIVQVGANDGLINDPLYDFNRMYSGRTRVLLIEPQTVLIPVLKKNYAFHKNTVVFNGAIGPNGALRLFSVKSSVWKRVKVHYAKGWPDYRAATGIASTNRDHVKRWLRKYGSRRIDIDDAICEETVVSMELMHVLKETNWQRSVDVLQVDAEGFDDQVIYHSNIDELRPKVINFEAKALSAESFEAIRAYLVERDYTVSRHGGEALAVLTKRCSCSQNGE